VLIDWFTVAAQFVNFLILVWLLRRFLYRPILKAIEAREKRISDGLSEAASQQTLAKKATEELQAKNQAFDEQRAAMMATAVADAAKERERLKAEAAKVGEDLRIQQFALLKDDQARTQEQLGLRVSDEVFAIARKALSELADAGLEERISNVFTRRLRDLEPADKAALAAAIGRPSEPAVLRSRFELPEALRSTLQTALNQAFSVDLHLRFETAPDTVGGIELSVHGQRLSWSIEGYVDAMKRRLDGLLDQAKPQPPAVANAIPKAPPMTAVAA